MQSKVLKIDLTLLVSNRSYNVLFLVNNYHFDKLTQIVMWP